MRPYLLLTPGPLTTSESVKTAMMTDWCTWDEDYNVHIVEEIRKGLVQLATPVHLSVSDRQAHPQPAGDEAPEEDEHAIASVDDGYTLPSVHGADDGGRHARCLHQHGVASSLQQVGGHEAGADVSEADG